MVSSASSTRLGGHSRDSIVAAALELIDDHGLEAFSTRRLAASLGLKVMSLYHYFPSRETLLDAAVDHMIAEVPLPMVARVQWQQGLLDLARDYRRMGHRHLRAIPLLAQRCPTSPTMSRFLDTLSSLLVSAGLDTAAAACWLVVLRDYVIGSLVADHAAYVFVSDSASLPNKKVRGGSGQMRDARAGKLREQVFEKGFAAMLAAIERERER